MNKPNWRYALVFLLGALVGLAGGAWGFRYFFHAWAKKDPAQHFLRKIDRELKLTEVQKAKVKEILDAKRAEMDNQRDEARPRFEAIRKEGEKEIRVVLNPDQAARFDELIQRMEKRRAKMPWAHCGPTETPSGSSPGR